ncbi:MAG: Imm40 family immunity protein [Treponema sp.]
MNVSIEMLKQNFGIAVNEYEIGFPLEHIFVVIKQYEALKIPILGGDVYIKENGIYTPTYDNWHVDKVQNEQENAYLKRSIAHVTQYIKNYKYKKSAVFVFVPN